MFCNHLAGAFDAVAQPPPAAAIMLAQLAQQDGTLFLWQRPDIGPPHRGGCNWYARTDVELDAQGQSVPALAEVDHAGAVAPADRNRPAGLEHQFFAKLLGQMTNAQICQRGITEGHCRWSQLILLKARDRRKITELGQSVGQAGNGWLRQFRAGRNLLIAKKP